MPRRKIEEFQTRDFLTASQENFCQEYAKTGDATESYMKAYNSKSKTSASGNSRNLLKQDKIQHRIQELLDASASAAIMDAREVREKLTAIVRSRLSSPEELTEEERAMVTKVQRDGKPPDWGAVMKALELLGKTHGIFIDKSQMNVQGELGVVIQDDVTE